MATRTPIPNKRLDRWLTRRGHTQVWLARELRVRPSTINELVKGKKAPSLALALDIERVTGIHPRAFEKIANIPRTLAEVA